MLAGQKDIFRGLGDISGLVGVLEIRVFYFSVSIVIGLCGGFLGVISPLGIIWASRCGF